MSLITKIKGFINNLFNKNIIQINGDDIVEVKKDINVDIITDNIVSLIQKEKELNDKLKINTNLLEDMKKLSKMSKEDNVEFDRIINSINNAQLEKEKVKNELKKINIKKIPEEFYDNFQSVLDEIKNQAEKQRIVKSDIDHLEGEKGYLEYQKEKYEKILKIMRYVGVTVSVIIGISILVLTFLYTFYDSNITLPVIVLFAITLFSIIWIYMWKRNINYQLQLNAKKQSKAVELLNKAKIKYVRYTNFLNYEYKKYGVDSYQKLEQMWQQYKLYKENNCQYMELSKYEKNVINGLENFFTRYAIIEKEYLFNNSDLIKTKKQRNEFLSHLERENKELKKSLQINKKEQNNHWKILNTLRDEDDILKLKIEQTIKRTLM